MYTCISFLVAADAVVVVVVVIAVFHTECCIHIHGGPSKVSCQVTRLPVTSQTRSYTTL